MAGPMPPAIGGMATVLNDIQNSSLAQKVQLEFFNTFKTTPEGRSLLTAVISKLSLWVKWCKLLRGNKQTIVHIHTCSGFTFFLDSILVCLAKAFSRPVILHIHGGRFDLFLDGLPRFIFKYVHWLMRHCHKIIVLSESWQDLLGGKFGLLPFAIVENGVPITDLSRQDNAKNGNVQILFLGNLTEQKGVWDLIQAMQKIKGATLNFVGGEEDPGIFDKIAEVIHTEHLEKIIIIHGPQYGDDKNKFWDSADIFVLPSYAEGLPISLLEAMANSLPVIVTPVGGIPIAITNGQEGLFVAVGQVEELEAALNTLVMDSSLRTKMGAAARKRCEEQFGIETVVSKLLAIYSEVF